MVDARQGALDHGFPRLWVPKTLGSPDRGFPTLGFPESMGGGQTIVPFFIPWFVPFVYFFAQAAFLD